MSTPAKACWGSLAKVDPSDEKALPSCAIARKIPNCKRAAKFFPEERGGLLDNWRAIPRQSLAQRKLCARYESGQRRLPANTGLQPVLPETGAKTARRAYYYW